MRIYKAVLLEYDIFLEVLSQEHLLFAHVVDFAFDDPENIGLIFSLDKKSYIFTYKLSKLLKENSCFILSQLSHLINFLNIYKD